MIARLHYITQDLPDFSHAELAELACKGGADWVQLRVKRPLTGSSPLGERDFFSMWMKIAEETKSVCKRYGVKLIINDNVQIAKEIEADGIHLGKEDMNPKEARKILGSKFIIGGSSNTMDDVRWLMDNGVNYIGIGPFRFTTTREKLNPILGLDGIKKIMKQLSPSGRGEGGGIPIIAIGGIKLEDVGPLMQTGIHGVAVSSAINRAEDKSDATKKFVLSLRRSKTTEAISKR